MRCTLFLKVLDHGLVKGYELVLLDPRRFVLVDLLAGCASCFHILQRLGQRFTIFCDTLDELMIPHIDSAGDELAAL